MARKDKCSDSRKLQSAVHIVYTFEGKSRFTARYKADVSLRTSCCLLRMLYSVALCYFRFEIFLIHLVTVT